MVNCEQTREELAVQALTGDRHGGLAVESAAHLGRCAECSTEQQQLAEVSLVLSGIDLLAFEGIRRPMP
jgi:predicted anti-sigma-YlaC factor YlaD